MEENEWLVCTWDEGGHHFVMSREAREWYVEFMFSIGETITSIVVKTFPNRNEAEKYSEKMNSIEGLLNDIL